MKRGSNLQDLALSNRSLILRIIRSNESVTRAELSKLTGLTEASISKVTRELVDQNIIEEAGFGTGKKGRRAISLRMKSESFHVIGVRISRRVIAMGIFDFSGLEIYSTRYPIDKDITQVEFQRLIIDKVQELAKVSTQIKAIGVAAPGPFLRDEGDILLMTGMRSFSKLHLNKELAPGIPAFFSHDANAGVIADSLFGDSLPTDDEILVHYLVGEGVGAGVLAHGKVFEGALGTAAEIGHMSIDANGPRCHCGNYGCLELYASTIAFVDHAKEKLQSHPNSTLSGITDLKYSDIFEAARAGDPFALDHCEEVAKYIAYGAVNLINAYNPSSLRISNDMAYGADLLFPTIQEVIQDRVLPELLEDLKLTMGNITDDPILYGAAAVAIDQCLKDPSYLTESTQA